MLGRYAVIEPNTRALERFDILFSDWEGWQCVLRSADADAALPPVDVVFVSVDAGFDGVDALLAQPAPPVIVALARDNAALDCAERGLGGYLSKPFVAAKCDALKARLSQRWLTHQAQQLTLRTDAGVVRVDVQAVMRVESRAKRSWVVTADAEGIVAPSLASLALDYPDWVRVRRDLLVPLHHITGMERDASGWRARIRGVEQPIPVSRRLAPDLRRRLAG